ncbi:MAG: CPBP family glutamic-type intramembrane protease, partial [Anaerolineae bacterium]
RNRATIRPYKRYGFRAVMIVVGLELLTVILTGGPFNFMGALILIGAIGWLMVRIWAFVNNGIFYSNKLNVRSFPLIAPQLGLPAPSEPSASAESTLSASISIEAASPSEPLPIETATALEAPLPIEMTPLAESPATITAPLETPIPPIDWRNYWLTTVGVSLGAVIYTALLFAITGPNIGAALREAINDHSRSVTLLTVVTLLEFAFTEELIFRLGIQNYLATKLQGRANGYWLAIVLTSIVWTLGHAGSLDPTWIKFAQIFPVGLALGWLYRRNGTESTIIAHALFNLAAAFVVALP